MHRSFYCVCALLLRLVFSTEDPLALEEHELGREITIAQWFSPAAPIIIIEALYIKKCIRYFLEEAVEDTLRADKQFQTLSGAIIDSNFRDLSGALSAVVALLTAFPRLGDELLRAHEKNPTALLCLHRFFGNEGKALLQCYESPGPYSDDAPFMIKIKRIPQKIRDMDYGLYINDNEVSRFSLVTLLAVKSKWRKNAMQEQIGVLSQMLLEYCDSEAVYLNLVVEFVRILYKLKFLSTLPHARTVLPMLIELAGRYGRIASIKYFTFDSPDEQIRRCMAAALGKYWSTREVRWADCCALYSFFYAYRHHFVNACGSIGEALYTQYCPEYISYDTSLWRLLSVESHFSCVPLNWFPPQLSYTLYYLCRQKESGAATKQLTRFLARLDDRNTAAFMCYALLDANDNNFKRCVTTHLGFLSGGRRVSLRKWVKQNAESVAEEYPDIWGNTPMGTAMEKLHDILCVEEAVSRYQRLK
ncbi:hypothetical protein PAPHI01_1955 [Pancytospora philotis]|nr:hypothetical protein PAPHI01_1955 [Pancytospora philotis]